MESKAKFMGHSIHQMLVSFPVGLLVGSVLFDVLSISADQPSLAAAAYWMLAAGIVGGLVAAPFGLIDLMAIPERTRASRIGSMHAVGNVIVLALFIGSWILRPSGDVAPPTMALALSLAGAALVILTAWMGAEMMTRLGIGVSPHANPDAINSMHGPAENPAVEPPVRPVQ